MIQDEKLQKRINWSPLWPKKHEGQQKILDAWNNGVEKIVVEAGTRFGKTQIASYIALKTFLNGLSDIKKGKRNSVKIWIIAPSYDLTRKIFENIIRWFLILNPGSVSIGDRPYPQIKIAEGVWIQGRSATEPESLLGEELDLAIIDEAARIKREIWNSYLFARLASRNGRALMISTPFGQNWFHEQYLMAKETGGGFNFRNIDNPYFPQDKWEEAKKMLPENVFKQEFEASALPDAAGVFRGVKEIIKDDCLKDVFAEHTYIIGVDFGKHEDFTAISVIDTYNNNLVYFDRFNKIDYVFQRERIKATARRYNNARVIVDSTVVGEPIREDLERDGVFVDDFRFTNKSKKELVEKLSIFIEQKFLWLPPQSLLIDELEAFGYKLSESGNVIYGAPQGLHDDCVISLALAVWGLSGRAIPKSLIRQEMEKVQFKLTKDNYI